MARNLDQLQFEQQTGTKRVFITTTCGFWITDDGANITYGFGTGQTAPGYWTVVPLPGGLVLKDQEPTPPRWAVITDSTTTGLVRELTLTFDSFETSIDSDSDCLEKEYARLSYEHVWSCLCGAALRVNCTPFPKVIFPAKILRSRFDTIDGKLCTFLEDGATDWHFTEPIYLPEASDFKLEFLLGNGGVAGKVSEVLEGEPLALNSIQKRRFPHLMTPDEEERPLAFRWTGIATILQEDNTKLC